MSGVAHRHLQMAYTGLQKSLQQEWAFVQRVTPGIGMAFQTVKYEMRDKFLPTLFQGAMSHIPRRAITVIPVKQAGIDLVDPTQTSGSNWTASCVTTCHLVAALCRTAEFRSGNHALVRGEGREEIRQQHTEAAETADTALGEAHASASKTDSQRMVRIQRTGAWVSVLPSTVNGRKLGVQE